jgi:hypothetical protein
LLESLPLLLWLSWFETREDALLTMRVLILRRCESAVSKDEAMEVEIVLGAHSQKLS